MSGVPKIKIAESVTELKMLMKQQKTGLRYAKVQSLYLLKIKAVENIGVGERVMLLLRFLSLKN